MSCWDWAVDLLLQGFDACVVWFGLLCNAIGVSQSFLLFLFSISAVVGLFILPMRGSALSDKTKRKQIANNSNDTPRLPSGGE